MTFASGVRYAFSRCYLSLVHVVQAAVRKELYVLLLMPSTREMNLSSLPWIGRLISAKQALATMAHLYEVWI